MSTNTKFFYILTIVCVLICLFVLSACNNGKSPVNSNPSIDEIPKLDKVFKDLSEYLEEYDCVSELENYSQYEFKDTNEVFAAFAYASARSLVYSGDITANLSSVVNYSDMDNATVLRRETSEETIGYSEVNDIYAYHKNALGTTYYASGSEKYTSLDEHLTALKEEDGITAYSYVSTLSEENRFKKFKVDKAWMENKLSDRVSYFLRLVDGCKGLSDFITLKINAGFPDFNIKTEGDKIILTLIGDSGTIEKPSELYITAKDGFITDCRAIYKGESLFMEEKTVDYSAEYNFNLNFETPVSTDIFGVKAQYKETKLISTVTFVSYMSFAGNFGDPLNVPILDNTDEAIFMGWYTDPELTEKFELKNFPSLDATLYPKWKARE